jgi:hypothetical protein
MAINPNGLVVYRGPSMLDGAPIIVIATGMVLDSVNGKTGALIQTWIIREDVSPGAAAHSGEDASICGACPHRGVVIDGRNHGRACYVNLAHAPRNIFESYHRGIYETAAPDRLADIFAGRKVRLGAYGDPAAAPFWLWSRMLSRADKWTGYSHQWRTCPPEFARFVMASCDTAEERAEAQRLGYRCFRVRTASEPLLPREVVCPASAEAGHKATCDSCVACGGTEAKARADIVIIAHGAASKVNAFAASRLAA